MTARRWRWGTVLLTVLLAACRIEQVPRPSRVDILEVAREDISTTIDAYRDALLAGDANALAETFSPDGRLSQPDQPDYIGRDEIRSGMQRVFETVAVTDLLLDRDDVAITEDSLAHEWGTFEETLQVPQQTATVLRGRYVIRWRRGQQQQWRIDRMLINHFPSDTTTAP